MPDNELSPTTLGNVTLVEDAPLPGSPAAMPGVTDPSRQQLEVAGSNPNSVLVGEVLPPAPETPRMQRVVSALGSGTKRFVEAAPGVLARLDKDFGVFDAARSAAAGMPGKKGAVARVGINLTQGAVRAHQYMRKNEAGSASPAPETPPAPDPTGKELVRHPAKFVGKARRPVDRSNGRIYFSSLGEDRYPAWGPHRAEQRPGDAVPYHLGLDPNMGLSDGQIRELSKTPKGISELARHAAQVRKAQSERIRLERGVSRDIGSDGRDQTPPTVNPHRIPRSKYFEEQYPESPEVHPPVWGAREAGYNTDPRVPRQGPKVPPIDRSPPKEKVLASDQRTVVEKTKAFLERAFRSRKGERLKAEQREASLDALESNNRFTQGMANVRRRAHAKSDSKYAKKGGHAHVSSGRSSDSRAPITGVDVPPKEYEHGREVVRVPRRKLKFDRGPNI